MNSLRFPREAHFVITKHIIVSGIVQGVGFRKYTQKRALENGINGWARNLASGEVEILAQTNDTHKMDIFLKYIKGGPERSQVLHFEMKDVESTRFTGHTFTVEADGVKSDS